MSLAGSYLLARYPASTDSHVLGVGGINNYPQILLGPILYEMICGMDLKTEKIW